jgi:hypothetical protein
VREVAKEQIKPGDLAHQGEDQYTSDPKDGYAASPRVQIICNTVGDLQYWGNIWANNDTLAGAINLLEPA